MQQQQEQQAPNTLIAPFAETGKFHIVVALTHTDGGIGANGKLPWRLPKEMDHFRCLTTSVIDPLKKNAVIMGRKTYTSIPAKFRPLKDRLNVVLSRDPDSLSSIGSEGVLTCTSLPAALDRLSSPALGIENVYVIGGAEVYEEAIRLVPCCQSVYTTLIKNYFQCDTHFPYEYLLKNYVYRKDCEIGDGQSRMEGDVTYTYVTWIPRGG